MQNQLNYIEICLQKKIKFNSYVIIVFLYFKIRTGNNNLPTYRKRNYVLLLINNPSLLLILFWDPVKTAFFLLADELIANGFIVLSCCGRRVKQKETPNIALFSLRELAELSSQPLPSQKKSSLTSRGKEHSV